MTLSALENSSTALNEDDTDVLQYSFKYFLESGTAASIEAAVEGKRLLARLLSILLDILDR